MSFKRLNPSKPHSLKCHFCFDLHSHCCTCRETVNGDDACVTGSRHCLVCASFSEEPIQNIANCDPDVGEVMFAGSSKELEESAQMFYNSPPKPSNVLHTSSHKPQQLSLEIFVIKISSASSSNLGHCFTIICREVDVSDLPSQYTEYIETFRHVLNLPDPRNNMPVSSSSVWGLNKEAP